MLKLALFDNIRVGVYIIITLTLLGGSFALISPSTVTATPSNTTSTTTSTPVQLATPPSAAQQIINNTQAECVQAQFLRGCVILVYESPTTVVLNGDVSIFGGSAESRRHYPNSFLWDAVDGFKAQGYTITTIGMNIVGNKSSDNEYHVIMSK